MRVIEEEHAGYEVREVPYGKVYSWNPGRLRVECECGAILDRKDPDFVCECGAKSEESLKGRDSSQNGGGNPWIEDYESWREEKEASGVNCEYYAFVEVGNDS